MANKKLEDNFIEIMKRVLSFVLGCIVCCSLTYAAALTKNVECLIQDNKHAEAIAVLEPLAKKGNGEAQNRLGEVYHFSPQPVQDYHKARRWYLKPCAMEVELPPII